MGHRTRPQTKRSARSIGGLRFAVPPYRKPKPTDPELIARDCAFRDAAAHAEWRRANGVVGPPLPGSR
jgi:hypothetical protein